VLVVAAMPIEMKPFARLLSLRKGMLGRTEVFTGSIARAASAAPAGAASSVASDLEVVGAVTGIGPDRARDTVERLLESTSVDHIVMIGVAGALDPDLHIGDLVVPAVVWDADTLASHHPVPVQEVATFGTLRTSGIMLTDAAALAPDREERGVIALDMETAAVADVSAQHDIAFSAFRAISDRVQDGIVDESTLKMTNPDGSANLWGAVKIIASRPSMLRKLSKLARDVQKATQVAAAAGVRECRAIAAA
jgi:adenosylhomocysteine nucleosidase